MLSLLYLYVSQFGLQGFVWLSVLAELLTTTWKTENREFTTRCNFTMNEITYNNRSYVKHTNMSEPRWSRPAACRLGAAGTGSRAPPKRLACWEGGQPGCPLCRKTPCRPRLTGGCRAGQEAVWAPSDQRPIRFTDWHRNVKTQHTFLNVPHVVHQQHGAVWHHGKVGGIEVW